jgi:biopolymer transport protein ExbB
MLHQVLNQVSQAGGETILALLLLVSIMTVAIISNRIWFFVCHYIDADKFARQILPVMGDEDWPKARNLARRSTASICLVVQAGLTQVDRGRGAMRDAMQSAKLHERLRLEGQLRLLGALGQSALLLGLLGTVFDLLEFSREPGAHAARLVDAFDAFFILAPTAAGLLVAIPALLAHSLLKGHVRSLIGQVDALIPLLLLQAPSPADRRIKPDTHDRTKAA